MSLDAPKLKAKDKPDLGSFDWEDPFFLDDQLTEEEIAAARARGVIEQIAGCSIAEIHAL